MLFKDLDTVVFASPLARAGAWRCPVDHPRFRDSGPIQAHLVAFPRTAVIIRQSGSRPVVADSTIATVYNLGREYDRRPLSPEGDRCEWFAVSPEVALGIAQELDPRPSTSSSTPFRFESAPIDQELYLRQRQLFLDLSANSVDELESEERILGLVASVIRQSLGCTRQVAGDKQVMSRRRELVSGARAVIASDLARPTDLRSLAGRLGASPFHLCRVFRAGTGTTLHQYRLELRFRAALERLADPQVDLSRLALELGFSSHAHFTERMRRWSGVTPSALRSALQG